MQDEDVGIEYEDESRQRLLRGHNTDDTESTLEFGVNPSMQDEDVGAASTSAASKAKPKAASKGAPFTKARPLPKRDPNVGDLYQTRDEESETEEEKCAQCHAPVKRPLAVNWCPKCKACIHTDCLEAHYVRRHGEPFDSSHPPASCLLPPSMRPKPPASPPPTYLMKNADGQGDGGNR